jgi:hypothetical protein
MECASIVSPAAALAPIQHEWKFFYLFTCEYCFSHYVTALFLLLTQFQMLYTGWRGFVISEFALVWIANIYMSAYNRLRLEIKAENRSIAEQTRTGADHP